MTSPIGPARSKALNWAAIIAVLFTIYFFRPYFSAIVLAAIIAYLSNGMFKRFSKHVKHPGSAVSLSLIGVFLFILIPTALITFFTYLQVKGLLDTTSGGTTASLSAAGQSILDWVNKLLSHFPGVDPITSAQVTDAINNAIEKLATSLLGLLNGIVGSIMGVVTWVTVFIYVYAALLLNQDKIIDYIGRLNPLGQGMTKTYLTRMAGMTDAMIKGQFVIAVCQGFIATMILQLAGIHGLFFFFFVLLTVLSIVPLGSGLVVFPIGIIMILTGDIWGGLFVCAAELFIVCSIDNVLRPRLVPKAIRMNSALTILSVFAGVALFGFMGIVVGPVLMIVAKVTIDAYVDQQKPATSPKELKA